MTTPRAKSPSAARSSRRTAPATAAAVAAPAAATPAPAASGREPTTRDYDLRDRHIVGHPTHPGVERPPAGGSGPAPPPRAPASLVSLLLLSVAASVATSLAVAAWAPAAPSGADSAAAASAAAASSAAASAAAARAHASEVAHVARVNALEAALSPRLRAAEAAAEAAAALAAQASETIAEQAMTVAALSARLEGMLSAFVGVDDQVGVLTALSRTAGPELAAVAARAAAAGDAADAAGKQAAAASAAAAARDAADAARATAAADAARRIEMRLTALASAVADAAAAAAAAADVATSAIAAAADALTVAGSYAAAGSAVSRALDAPPPRLASAAAGGGADPLRVSTRVVPPGRSPAAVDGLRLAAEAEAEPHLRLARLGDVLALVDAALARATHGDGVGLPDFALAAAGATVMDAFTSVTYVPPTPPGRAGAAHRPPPHPPAMALSTDVGLGSCWAFPGAAGTLGVRLAAPAPPPAAAGVVLTAVTIDHAAPELALAPTAVADGGDGASRPASASAPTTFSVWGLTPPPSNGSAATEGGRAFLGRFAYDAAGPPTQTFLFEAGGAGGGAAFPAVQLAVEANGGNPDFTCLYRFRVHGRVPSEADTDGGAATAGFGVPE